MRRLASTWALVLTVAALTFCMWQLGSAGGRALIAPSAATPTAVPVAPAHPGQHAVGRVPVTSTRTGTGPTVWVFGDSICAGQNLPPAQAWPARLAARAHVTVVNWCRPGYAFSGYLGNVSDELAAAYASGQPVPSTVIVAAGSNDLPIHDQASIVASEFAALAVRDSLVQHGATRVLFAAVIPRGDGYEQLRQQLNLWMAIAFGADYQPVDFFLNPPNWAKYYQADRLHPNAAGQQLIADTFDASTLPGTVAKRTQPVKPQQVGR